MAARIEIRAYADGWLHCYRPEELQSGCELVTPGCAETATFYPVDHERSQIGRVERAGRAEFCPGCLTWARGLAALGPAPVQRGRHAEPDTLVLPALAGIIRGVL